MITPAQIKAARALVGWKQADLAKAAKLSLTALNNIERGEADPKRATVSGFVRCTSPHCMPPHRMPPAHD